MIEFEGLKDLMACVGQTLGQSPWLQVTQEQVDRFAQATLDQQWIHVDAERAKKGPFGATIVHGFLTLSLIPAMLLKTLRVKEDLTFINYGLNRVRFTSVLLVGQWVSAVFDLKDAQVLDEHGNVQLTWSINIMARGHDKPVCVAEMLMRCVRFSAPI